MTDAADKVRYEQFDRILNLFIAINAHIVSEEYRLSIHIHSLCIYLTGIFLCGICVFQHKSEEVKGKDCIH